MGTRRGRGPTWFRSLAARDGEGTCCCGWRCCYGRACCCDWEKEEVERVRKGRRREETEGEEDRGER
ncbi:hypothetical protein AAC387_Pa03g3819 [Persea americana]